MAKPNKLRSKGDQKIKCEYSGCTVTFSRDSDRRRHVKEKHGTRIYCCYPGCQWTTRRMGRLTNHLNNIHHSQVSTNRPLLSEFRTATAQSMATPNYFSALDANFSFNFDPTTPPISTDYVFTPQVPHDDFESLVAFNSEQASTYEHNPTLDSSGDSSMRVQMARYRIFKPCRLRRRTPCHTACKSSAGPSRTQLSSAMVSTPDLSPSQQESPTFFTQLMPYTFNAEPIASVLGSLSLDESINRLCYQPTNSQWQPK